MSKISILSNLGAALCLHHLLMEVHSIILYNSMIAWPRQQLQNEQNKADHCARQTFGFFSRFGMYTNNTYDFVLKKKLENINMTDIR